MKNLFKIFLLFILFLANFLIVKASDTETINPIKVTVTEKVPGVNCTAETETGGVLTGRRICEVKPGMTSFQEMLGSIIKYLTSIGALAGVLFIVINGIMLSMGGLDSSVKDKTKKSIKGAITGLGLLLLSGVILSALFPWIYK